MISPAKAPRKTDIPPGFELMPPFGPFHQLSGPIYVKKTEDGFTIGLLVEEKHRNAGQMVHGGMLAMLADTACTWASKHSRQPVRRVLTSHLSVGFTGNAVPGDWLEARVQVVKSGRRVVFSNCFIWSREKCIAHATAQFQVIGEETE
ncbi:MAG: PaaI family thioesterase [Azonexus sp.]|nr:PaaI family thioesterase [Azonexus sp.]